MTTEFKSALPTRCKASVTPPGMWHEHQCSRKPWKDGWCKQHHPDTEAARRKKLDDEYERKMARTPSARLVKLQKKHQALVDGVRFQASKCRMVGEEAELAGKMELAEQMIGTADELEALLPEQDVNE